MSQQQQDGDWNVWRKVFDRHLFRRDRLSAAVSVMLLGVLGVLGSLLLTAVIPQNWFAIGIFAVLGIIYLAWIVREYHD